MAGRIRTIKPELLEDEKTAELDHESWRVFVSLLLVADDHGNCRANPNYLRGQILHSSPDSRDFRETLARLSTAGLVTLYTVREQQYLHISGWDKHQKVDRPSKPRVPTPEEAENSEIPAEDSSSREDAVSPRESLATDPDHRPRPPTTDPDLSEGSDTQPGSGDRGDAHLQACDRAFTQKTRNGTEWPDDFVPSPANVEKARDCGLDIDEEVELCGNHQRAAGKVSCDWQSVLSTWLTRAVKFRAKDEKREKAKGGRQRARRGGFVPQGNHGKTGTENVERI